MAIAFGNLGMAGVGGIIRMSFSLIITSLSFPFCKCCGIMSLRIYLKEASLQHNTWKATTPLPSSGQVVDILFCGDWETGQSWRTRHLICQRTSHSPSFDFQQWGFKWVLRDLTFFFCLIDSELWASLLLLSILSYFISAVLILFNLFSLLMGPQNTVRNISDVLKNHNN